MITRLALAIIVSVLVPLASAQDKPATAEQLKERAAEALKKSDVKDASIVATDNLILAATLPATKTKLVAEQLQKTFVVAGKGLRFTPAELQALRIVIYTFSDLDNFKQFQRAVLKERPGDDEFAVFDVRRDDPFIAVSARRGEKTPNFEQIAGSELCRALLVKKGGNARLTEWMKDGFARAVQMRVNPGTVGSDRAAVARLAPRLAKGAKATPVVDRAWSGTGKEKDLVAASFMDFLTFGPGSEKLSGFFSGLLPSDGNDNPTVANALMSADWMLEDVDRAWRDWLAKGTPASK